MLPRKYVTKKMNGSNSLPTRLLLSLTSFAVFFGLAEGVLRVVHHTRPPLLFKPFEDTMHENHLDDFLHVVSDDPDTFWRLKPHTRLPDTLPGIRGLVANQQGLREDHVIETDKPDNELRILFLGDSCTFGFGCLQHEVYVEKLEKLINTPDQTKWVECINAGVPGYTIFQGWRKLETECWSYKPDLVVVAFGWNETRKWANISDYAHFKIEQSLTPPGMLRHSRLISHVYRRIRSHHVPLPNADAQVRVSPEEFTELLGRINADCLAHNTEMAVMPWPYTRNFKTPERNLTEYQLRLIDFGRTVLSSNIVGLIDAGPDIQKELASTSANKIFIDYGHMRPHGNEVMARSIAQQLEPWLQHHRTSAGLLH